MPRKNRATKQETLELLNQNLHKSLVKDQRHEKLLILNEKTLFGRDGTNIERRKNIKKLTIKNYRLNGDNQVNGYALIGSL